MDASQSLSQRVYKLVNKKKLVESASKIRAGGFVRFKYRSAWVYFQTGFIPVCCSSL